MIDDFGCSDNTCAEATLQCGSASYRLWSGFEGGSFAAALQDLTRPAPARENTVAGLPLTQGGEGIFILWFKGPQSRLKL